MTNWNIFATFMTSLMTGIQAAYDAMLAGSLGYVREFIFLAVTAWIAARAIMVANRFSGMNDLWRDLIRCAVVVTLLQAANYNQYIAALATAIPNEVGNALAETGAGNMANGAAFDTVWNAAAKAGMATWEQVPKYSLSSIPLWCAIIVYWAIALVAIGISFLVYLASTILLLLLLAVGPLFIALFAFPVSAKFASGWVAAVVSAILTQVFSVAILVLFVGVQITIISRVRTGIVDGNFINAIFGLGEAALLMSIIATLVKQAPAFAQGIAGGVYQNVASMVSAPTAAGSGVGSAAQSGAKKLAQKVQAARVSNPTGRSLSSSGG